MTERVAAPELPSQFRGLITCKGVVWQQDTVVLLKNRRDEWELPGGKVDLGESFAGALVREFQEELALHVEVGALLDADYHHYYANVVVLTYGCFAEPFTSLTFTAEHHGVERFTLGELSHLDLPVWTRRSIERWAGRERPN